MPGVWSVQRGRAGYDAINNGQGSLTQEPNLPNKLPAIFEAISGPFYNRPGSTAAYPAISTNFCVAVSRSNDVPRDRL